DPAAINETWLRLDEVDIQIAMLLAENHRIHLVHLRLAIHRNAVPAGERVESGCIAGRERFSDLTNEASLRRARPRRRRARSRRGLCMIVMVVIALAGLAAGYGQENNRTRAAGGDRSIHRLLPSVGLKDVTSTKKFVRGLTYSRDRNPRSD